MILMLCALFAAIFSSTQTVQAYWVESLDTNELRTQSEAIHFVDANLEAEVRKAISKPTGDIFRSDVEGINVLNAQSRGISDLTGIENIRNLTELYLGANHINDLARLTGLTNLTYLYLYSNHISDLTPLAGLSNLTNLDLSMNQITNITAMEGLTNLSYLGLSNNQIADITPLVENPGIAAYDYVYLAYNDFDLRVGSPDLLNIQALVERGAYVYFTPNGPKITFPDPALEVAVRQAIGKPTGDIYLSEVGALTILHAEGRGIANLAGIENLTNLAELGLSNNQICDITPVASLTNLTKIYLYDNLASDITPLSNLTELEHLQIHNNQISDIGPLAGISKLSELYLGRNQISNITALTGLTNLTHLLLHDNLVSDVTSLTRLISLKEIWLQNNQITDISPLAELTNLNCLYLQGNHIVNITALTGLTELNKLWLHNNQITNIQPLAGLYKLNSIALGGNNISDIASLTNSTNVSELWLDRNVISNIAPLANLVGLVNVYLDVNQISDLSPLARLTNLKYLNLANNQISDITALVANNSIGAGDTVRLQGNYLDCTEGTQNMIHIHTLLNRGVSVSYLPQNVVLYSLSISVTGNGTTNPSAESMFTKGAIVTVTAHPNSGYYFSHWGGDAAGANQNIEILMDTNKSLIANFAPERMTLVGAIIQTPSIWEGQVVTISGEYRGWESGHGAPPVTRSDWILKDETGYIYINGIGGMRYPSDLGKPVQITGIIRLKNGIPYIEVPRSGRR